VLSETVAREDGTSLLRAPPGSYRVRVRRIGYLPFLSEPVSVPGSGEIVLLVESPRVVLQTIVVTSKSGCVSIDRDERALGVLWDEIAKALRTSQLTPQDFAGIARSFVYRRKLSRSGIVLSSDTVFYPVRNRKPFRMRDPKLLAAQGYVFGDERLGWTYYGPDETVLLSEQFAGTHCFRVVRERGRSGQIGIEFKPVKGRELPDITGVLWVDEKSAELRELIFRFVNAGLLGRFKAGGFTRFRRVPSGGWIVDDWALRGPLLRQVQGMVTIEGYVEDGGGIAMGAEPPPTGLPLNDE
jgi:hypothetical protein